ncbi:YwhD family protein [Corticicoccus populi]|uniref:YwhD family protein n=1 Tax=Corticicoccus populi TaxID=1812821 RepID=A0ABW5WWU9_9STAP
MADETENKKPGFQFNIIKNDPLDGHRGQNLGAISLENVAPVYVDIDTQEVFIDIGGLHARADVEKRVKWVTDKSEAEGEGSKEYWLVWVTVERTETGPVYHGVTSCYEMVNKSKKRGYKLMHEHVNMMDKSMKGLIQLDGVDDESLASLKQFLMNHNPEMWNNSRELQNVLKSY